MHRKREIPNIFGGKTKTARSVRMHLTLKAKCMLNKNYIKKKIIKVIQRKDKHAYTEVKEKRKYKLNNLKKTP